MADTTTFTDAFGRANETPIASPWRGGYSGFLDLNLASNHVRAPAINTDAIATVNQVFANDQWAQVDIVANVANVRWAMIWLRVSNPTAAPSAYVVAAEISPGNVTRYIIQFVAGTATVLATVSGSPGALTTLKGRVYGTTIELWYNGSLDLTTTDSAVASGTVGMQAYVDTAVTDIELDNFVAGAITSDQAVAGATRSTAASLLAPVVTTGVTVAGATRASAATLTAPTVVLTTQVVAGATRATTLILRPPSLPNLTEPDLGLAGLTMSVYSSDLSTGPTLYSTLPTRAACRIDAYLSGAWTPLTDLAATGEINATRGMSGSGPNDRLAVTGQCTFTLRNDGANGHVIGRYSPNHVNVRAGWTFGIPVRLVAQYAARPDDVLWTGKLTGIDPVPGVRGARTVACTAVDCMDDLAQTDVRTVPPQISQAENALIAAILAAVPAVSRPVAVYDASLDTFPYALDNASEGVMAMALLTDVVISAQAYCYPLRDGRLRIENRHARALAVSQFTFDDNTLADIDVPSSLDLVYNHARVTFHPRTFSAPGIVLFELTVATLINVGQSLEIWGDYSDPANALRLAGAFNTIAPVVNTDYMANSLATGAGVDYTANITVVATAFAASVKFVVTNNAGVQIYLVTTAGVPRLQIRGTAIYDSDPLSVESLAPAAYDRMATLDLRYQYDGTIAKDLADLVVAQYGSLPDQVQALAFIGNRDPALMMQALVGEIGDIVTASESMSGVASVPTVIHSITYTVRADGTLRVRYGTTPRGPRTTFILDDATLGVLDAPLSRLGYA